MKKRTGFSLIEAMIAVLVLSFTVTVFASLYPTAARLRSKSENVTQATMLAQKKIEQVRAIPYASLTYTGLQANSIIDASPNSSPYTFTTTDNLAIKLPAPSGTVSISTPSTDLKRVDVTISWGGVIANGNSVTASTLIANKEVMTR